MIIEKRVRFRPVSQSGRRSSGKTLASTSPLAAGQVNAVPRSKRSHAGGTSARARASGWRAHAPVSVRVNPDPRGATDVTQLVSRRPRPLTGRLPVSRTVDLDPAPFSSRSEKGRLMLRISYFQQRDLDGSCAWQTREHRSNFDQSLRTRTRVRRLEEMSRYEPSQHRWNERWR